MKSQKKIKHLVFKIPADDVEALLKEARFVAEQYGNVGGGTFAAMSFAHGVEVQLEDPQGEEWLV